MHSHQKKTLSERTESSNFSHYCSSSQISICELNSVLNLTHRRYTNQVTEFCKKRASSQMKSMINSQKISLKRNKNIRADLQDTQTAQRTVKDLKLHHSLTIIRQDRASSISVSKKDVRLSLF